MSCMRSDLYQRLDQVKHRAGVVTSVAVGILLYEYKWVCAAVHKKVVDRMAPRGCKLSIAYTPPFTVRP